MCTDVSKLYESLLRFRSGSSSEECFYYSFVQGNLLEGDILWLAYHIGTSGPRKLTSFRKVSFTAMPDLSRIEGAVIDWNFTYKLNVSCQWPWSATLATSAFQARGDMLTHADFYVRKRVFASPAKKVGDEYILEDGTETIFFPIYDADESFGTMILRSRENISIQIVDTEERCALFRGGMNYAVIRDRIVKISQVSEDNYLLPPGMTSSSSVSSSANQLQDTKPHTIDMVGPGHVGKCTIVASQTVTNDVTPMRLYKPRTTKRDVSPLRFPTTPVQNSFDGFLSMLRGSRSCTPDQSRDENAPVISTTSSTVTIDSGPVLPALKVCVMHVGLEVDSILDIIHRDMSRSRSLVPWLVLPTREMLRSTDVFDWQMRDARRRYDESMHTDHQELWDRRLERRWPILRELLLLKSQLEIPEISILDNLLRDAVMNRSIYQTKLVIMSLLKNSENTLTLISEARVILWLSIEAPPVLLRWVTSFF